MKKKYFLLLLVATICFAQEPNEFEEAPEIAPNTETVPAPDEQSTVSEAPSLDVPAPEAAPTMPSEAVADTPTFEAPAQASSVQSLNFNYAPGKSRLEVGLSSDAEYETTILDNDRQVVLEIKNATIPRRFSRKLDTSSFRSNVSLVSPYQSGDNVRIVFQLKEAGSVDFVREGNRLVAVIDNKEGSSATTAAQSEVSADVNAMNETVPTPESVSAPDQTQTLSDASTANGTTESIDSFLQARGTKRYLGKPITLQLRDAEVHDVFRVIAEASEFNIVLGDDVKGKLTLNLIDVPWDQALDIILNTNRLAAERFGSVLRVTTVESLTKEKEAEATAKRAAEAAEPLVVKIFPISYAKPEDMKRILEDFLSKEFAGNAAGGGRRGSIQIEPRTNALVVRDTPSTMEKLKRILRELDTQTPQVLIEAKFVEVSETKSKEVQGRIFATSRESGSEGLGFGASNANWGTLFGGSSFTSLPTSFAVSPVPGASFGFSPKVGVIPGIREIGAFLSILETQEQSKTIASPRVVTQNKEKATIKQGQTILLATAGGVGTSGSFQTVAAELSLDVTPQVTADGNITMKLVFTQNTPSSTSLFASQGATNNKSVDTTVLVDSGATLVIGGVYQTQTTDAEAGIPLLRNLPIIGALFGSKGTIVSKTELFIFLTPRVLNEKEAGIKG